MTTPEKIGAAIVQLRKERGISQEELSLNASIGRRYMSDIENGKRNLSLDILERLAKYFGITLSTLFTKAEAIGVPQPKLDDIQQWLDDRCDEDSVILRNPDFVSAIIGVSEDGRVVYSHEKMVEDLMQNHGMTYEDAIDDISYNTIRALDYMGEKAPIIVFEMEK